LVLVICISRVAATFRLNLIGDADCILLTFWHVSNKAFIAGFPFGLRHDLSDGIGL
jgi:hypothetical protein